MVVLAEAVVLEHVPENARILAPVLAIQRVRKLAQTFVPTGVLVVQILAAKVVPPDVEPVAEVLAADAEVHAITDVPDVLEVVEALHAKEGAMEIAEKHAGMIAQKAADLYVPVVHKIALRLATINAILFVRMFASVFAAQHAPEPVMGRVKQLAMDKQAL